jgi:site-specific DNA recombinase
MINRSIDLDRPLRCTRYGRMSDENQNPKSPEQQFAEIERIIRLQRRPWQIVRDYRDNAVKGKYIGKRPEFQRMLREIRTGGLKVDAILVDTWERFARAEEAPAIRHGLLNKYGVIVLTADSNFVDPTTIAGKAVGFVEQIRATNGNEVKAHDVLRAKLELARNKRWPGGPVPFGKKLVQRVVTGPNGNDLIEPALDNNPRCDWIVQKLFALAKASGKGAPWLAKQLSDDPTIPDELKPFTGSFVAYVLDNPIYKGTLRFNAKCTGIIDDTRVQRRNPVEEVLLIDGVCAPLVPAADWDAVHAVRRRRSDAIKAARAANRGDVGDEKQIVALGAGLTLKYLLTGLIYCAECGARMAPCSSTGAVKEGRRYAYYRCPRRGGGGGCRNTYYVREDKLRAAVLARVRTVLFPRPPAAGDGGSAAPDWLEPLMSEVRTELESLSTRTPDQRQGLQEELDELRGQMNGWLQSLGRRDLPQALRQDLENQYQRSADRAQAIENQMSDLNGHTERLDDALDARQAIEVLARLEEVLGSANVTDGNFQLSLHIDRIDVSGDGTIIMRTCKLGAFAGAAELLSAATASAGAATSKDVAGSRHRVKNRRRGRLRLDSGGDGGPVSSTAGAGTEGTATAPTQADELRVADTGRFAHLSDRWFWVDHLPVERRIAWAEAHAGEVSALRQEDPKRWSLRVLAEHFEVSKPTIQNALRKAAAAKATRATSANDAVSHPASDSPSPPAAAA